MVSIFAFLILIFPLPQPDDSLDINYFTDSGYAEFTSSVPLHSFTGESEHLTGMIDFRENLVDFYLDLTTLDTGIGSRDRDMRQTLNTDDFPFAEFTGSLQTPFDMDSREEQAVQVNGEFTINGHTREVSVEGTLQKRGDQLVLKADWNIRLEDYNIEAPGILFYRVDEVQQIQIEATLSPRDRESLE